MNHPTTGQAAEIFVRTIGGIEYVDRTHRCIVDGKDVKPLFGTADMFPTGGGDFHATRFNREYLSRVDGKISKGFHSR